MALESPEPGSGYPENAEPESLERVTDAQLVARALAAKTGGERAPLFEEISRRYYKVVLRWCARHLYDRPGAEQDVGHEAFLAAFEKLSNGEGPANPDELAGWLIRFADNRVKEYVRTQGAAMRLITSSDTSFELLPDVDPDAGRKERLAETNGLVHVVVGTLTQQQQQIYQLRFIQELTGPQIAPLLGLKPQNASNQARMVKDLIGKGVGALVLATEGRGHCQELDQILDAAGFNGTNFTASLREQIVRHYDDCAVCRNCPVCSVEQKKLTLPHMPVLIPLLGAAEFRDRIAELIHAVTTQTEPQHTTRQRTTRRRRRPPRRDRTRSGEHGPDDRTRPPRRRLRARRSTWYGAAAAAAALALVAALLIVPHGHAAGGTHGKGGSVAVPAALIANETAAKVAAVKVSNPISSGPLLGPDGLLWTESIPTAGTNVTLTATSPTSYAATTYKLPATLGGATVFYAGGAAFDSAGHLWLTADLRTGNPASPTYDQVLLQYTAGSGAVQQFAEDSSCARASSDDSTELYEANDGAVWVVCNANFAGGGAVFYRMTPGGGITTMTIVNNSTPGSLLAVAYTELPFSGSGPLVQGPGGTMYALDDDGIVQLTPGGQETLAIDDKDDEPVQLAGNGSGLLEAVSVCDVTDASGEQSKQCVSKVNTDGSETTIAYLPYYDGYNDFLVHWAVMSSSGNLWLILDTPGPPPIKQYYVEVSPGGAVTTFPFTVPGDTVPVQVSQAPPVITPNGGLWTPDDQDAVSATWSLIQIVPK